MQPGPIPTFESFLTQRADESAKPIPGIPIEPGKTTLVVIGDDILGMVHSSQPDRAFGIRCMAARGARIYGPGEPIWPGMHMDEIRLASQDDFNDFEVSFRHYNKPDEYIWAKR